MTQTTACFTIYLLTCAAKSAHEYSIIPNFVDCMKLRLLKTKIYKPFVQNLFLKPQLYCTTADIEYEADQIMVAEITDEHRD